MCNEIVLCHSSVAIAVVFLRSGSHKTILSPSQHRRKASIILSTRLSAACLSLSFPRTAVTASRRLPWRWQIIGGTCGLIVLIFQKGSFFFSLTALADLLSVVIFLFEQNIRYPDQVLQRSANHEDQLSSSPCQWSCCSRVHRYILPERKVNVYEQGIRQTLKPATSSQRISACT